MTSESDYYDHYKDTFAIQQGNLSERNKMTVYLLVLLVLLMVFIYDPAMLNKQINGYLANKVEGIAIELKFLNTGIIFLILWVMIRYYQLVFEVERLYKYLTEIEAKLSVDHKFIINREGAYYLKSYPWFKDFLDFCYVRVLPFGIISTAVLRIYTESNWATNFRYVDYIGLVLIIIFSLLYLSNRVLGEEFFDKKRYPNMSVCDRVLAYFKLK